jgi:hypothetical protein
MKIGFVTFCTENYIGIMNNLLESVLSFSKYNIIVYCLNFNYKHDSNRVQIKRVDLDNLSYFNICKMKLYATIDCGLDIGLILDCDMIVTNQIDNIFEENLDKVINSEYPLFAKHPDNPFDKADYADMIKKYTNKKPKMKWVYASYLFSKKNVWFIEKVYNEMSQINNQIGEDELIINAFLTDYEVNYDIGYNYLPNGLNDMIDIFFNRVENTVDNNYYLQRDCPVKFFIFHGHLCKNVNEGKKLINEIKNL